MVITCEHGHPIELLTTEEVAARLGRSKRVIQQLSQTHGLGSMIGGIRLFTYADLPRFAALKPGRPPKRNERL